MVNTFLEERFVHPRDPSDMLVRGTLSGSRPFQDLVYIILLYEFERVSFSDMGIRTALETCEGIITKYK